MNKPKSIESPKPKPEIAPADELPYPIQSALKAQVKKVENRALVRTQALEKDILELIRDFIAGYNIIYMRIGDSAGSYEMDRAVRTFCRDLYNQVAEIDTRRFIDSFADKIMEVNDAEKTNG